MKVAKSIFFTLKQERNFVKQNPERHKSQLRYIVLLLLSFVIILTGCATTGVRLPNVQEEEAIQLKNKTIVLLRLKVENDGEPFNPSNNLSASGENSRFRLKLANMDKGEYPGYIAFRCGNNIYLEQQNKYPSRFSIIGIQERRLDVLGFESWHLLPFILPTRVHGTVPRLYISGASFRFQVLRS